MSARGLQTSRDDSGPSDIAVSPDGRFVYVGTVGIDWVSVAVFSRDEDSGMLVQLPGTAGCLAGRPATDARTQGMARRGELLGAGITISPDGRFLYVEAAGSSRLPAISSTGALTPVPSDAVCLPNSGHGCQPVRHGEQARSMLLSEDGLNAYFVSAIDTP